MKKIICFAVTFILSAAFCVSLAACGTSLGEDDRETLTIGLECAYAPYNWTQTDDSNGAVQIDGTSDYANGYDIKIAKYIAAALDRKLIVKKMIWDSLIPAVQAGTVDMIIAGMSPTAERKESVDFSDSYYESNLVAVVRKNGNYANAKSLADLSGANIVAQRNTFHAIALEQLRTVGNSQLYEDFTTMIVALSAKAIDGYIAEQPGAIADCNKNPDFTYVKLENNTTGFTINDMSDVQLAAAFKKGSALLATVNEILKGLSEPLRLALMTNAINQQVII